VIRDEHRRRAIIGYGRSAVTTPQRALLHNTARKDNREKLTVQTAAKRKKKEFKEFKENGRDELLLVRSRFVHSAILWSHRMSRSSSLPVPAYSLNSSNSLYSLNSFSL
jgi:hypothetical protein